MRSLSLFYSLAFRRHLGDGLENADIIKEPCFYSMGYMKTTQSKTSDIFATNTSGVEETKDGNTNQAQAALLHERAD